AALRRLGAEVRDVQIPSLAATQSFMLILLAEAYAYHERDLREHPELYGEVLRERFLAGGLVTGAEYSQAQRIRSEIRPGPCALARVCRARASALALACVALAGCSLSPPRIAATPETIAVVTRESPIVAVHYQDIIQATPPTEGAPSEPRWASVGAPTRRIKE